MVRREHDYTDTDSHAEDFIRAVVRLGEEPARKGLPSGQISATEGAGSWYPVIGHAADYI